MDARATLNAPALSFARFTSPEAATGYIDPTKFAQRMDKRWQHLGNVSSSKLVRLWTIMGETFNEAAEKSEDGTWRVLEPPTGSGKTQGCCVYAAMVIEHNAA
jgi:hypothetical protein